MNYEENFSSRPIWWHYLCVIVPHKLTRPNTSFMLIDQGSNTDRSVFLYFRINKNILVDNDT